MRICFNCGSDKTYVRKDGIEHWYNRNDNWYCNKCYMKLIDNPKWHPITNPMWNSITNPKHLVFKGKTIQLKERVLTGVCSLCGTADRKTNMHHIKYHDNDPLKDTIELCQSCHVKEHWRLGSKLGRHKK